jgi:hypothetical protein
MWISSVNILFTCLIQLSAEMRTANPILAVYSLRRFDVALDCLRLLADYWLNADIVLRLFEESSERLQQELKIGKARKLPHASNTKTGPGAAPAFDDGPSNSNEDGCDDLANIDWRDLYAYNQDALQLTGEQTAGGEWETQYWENSGLFLPDIFETFPS